MLKATKLRALLRMYRHGVNGAAAEGRAGVRELDPD